MLEVTISEYGFIGCDNISTDNNKYIGKRDLSEKLFKELYNFWLEDKDTQKIFSFENKKCLKAINYVGIIQTENLSIEILPKVYDDEKNRDKYRTIFFEMLKPLLNINHIEKNNANISTNKNKNIHEIFISHFILSVDKLIHTGLKSSYLIKEENQYFLKGKLLFNQQIKENFIHKERFYTAFDEYSVDRVENRLIKSTIKLLLKKTHNYENKKALRQQLFIFDNIKLSKNYKTDFKKVNIYRGMEYYKEPLNFAKVFLMNESFTSLRGDTNLISLLFPMEKVFEDYMEFLLNNSKSSLGIKEVKVNGYKNEYLLSGNQIRLQPDYLLDMKDGYKIITDAKWKLFDHENNSDNDKVNISSSDVYQINSYLHYYDASNTAYIFIPKTKNISNVSELFFNKTGNIKTYKKIVIVPIDLHKAIKDDTLDINFTKD